MTSIGAAPSAEPIGNTLAPSSRDSGRVRRGSALKMLGAGAGGFCSQAVALLCLPIISRVYDQKEIGIWAVWLGSVAIVASVSYLRYELAVVVAEAKEASDVLWLGALLLLAVTALTGLACLSPVVRRLVGAPDDVSAWLRWGAPLLILGMGATQLLQAWCVRVERYWVNSLSQVAIALGVPLVQLLASPAHPGASGLAAGSLIGQWLGASVLFAGVLCSPDRPRAYPSAPSRLLSSARKHRNFALYSAPYTLFGVLRDRASLLVLQGYVSSTLVGQYAYAWRSLNFPVTLLSGAIRPVLFRDSAQVGIAAVESLVVRILTCLAVAGTPLLVLFLSMPDRFFALVFGSQWAAAGDIGIWIIWPIFTFMFCNWLDRVLDVLKRQRLSLLMEVSFSVLTLGAMLVAFRTGGGLRGALLAQACVLVTYNVLYLLVAFSVAGFPMGSLGRIAAAAVGSGALSVALLWSLRQMLTVWGAVGAFSLLYAAALSLVGWQLKSRGSA